jgi:hypothetical protein
VATLTPAQGRALAAVAEFGDNGEGWAEVELQFECSTPARESFPPHLWPSLCTRVFGALERKGYITRGADGPRLTDYGKQTLSTRERAGEGG